MEPRHDRTDRAGERARDLAVAEIVDVGELEDAALGRLELRQRRAQGHFVDGRRVRIGEGRLGRDREHARAQPFVAPLAPALAHCQVGEDAAQPGAAVRAGAITVPRRQGAGEGLLYEIIGLAAGQAVREAMEQRRMGQKLGGKLGDVHGAGEEQPPCRQGFQLLK
jgi:hypothetical protein